MDNRYGKIKSKDAAGQTFGRLTAIRRVSKTTSRSAVWECQCICGKVVNVPGYALRSGHSKSCGCLRDEVHAVLMRERSTTHGMRHTRIYKTWSEIVNRCGDVKNLKYGGRGISVCERWRKFEKFYADMGDHPGPRYSIERKDVNGDYSPENCVWATTIEQARNHRVQKNSKTGVPGVYWKTAAQKFQARINVGKMGRISLGYYKNIQDAISARLSAEERYWGKSNGVLPYEYEADGRAFQE